MVILNIYPVYLAKINHFNIICVTQFLVKVI